MKVDGPNVPIGKPPVTPEQANMGQNKKLSSETSTAQQTPKASDDVKVNLNKTDAAEKFDGAKVKEAVLSHVSKALAEARQRGVDESEIQSLKQQALKGVEQGFGQALKDLDEMNQLSPKLTQKIGDTLDDIKSAIQEDDYSSLTDKQKLAKAEQEGGFVSQGYFRNNQSLNLMVRTRDGDQVQISLLQDREAISQLRGDNQQLLGRWQLEQAGALQFSVSGNLSEQEKSALNDIINQVGSIANRFFNGELDSAFELAKELDIGGTELASLSLNLRETTTMASAYGEASGAKRLPQGLSPLAQFVEQVMGAAKDSEQAGFDKLLPVDLLEMRPEMNDTRGQLLNDVRDLLTNMSKG
ncbi:DUF5610 domain-containing protein [Salinibius halmophilus]|uniref:DUF5610 domain-containing protein n=1 Tax=Salinibius halmophilus TaxID=1853216 RepID=UPI000E66A0A1|nr:DUF5610 domain-containing protein [Salinibius halmophilus]